MVRVRGFRWSDLDGVLEVRNSWREAGAATRAGLEGYLRRGGARPERNVWVVEEGERILAYGSLRPWHSPGWLQVEVVVRPERRGQGLGSALLRRLERVALGRGSVALGAVVRDDDRAASEFVRRRGFEPFVARQHLRLRPVVVPPAEPVTGYRLRRARVEESAQLAALTNAAYGASERVGGADAEGYRRYLEESGAWVWVAEGEGGRELAGLCEVYGRDVEIDGETVRSGHVASVAVHPLRRGQGLGRWLLSAGIGSCREAGWPTVELNVDRDNASALCLYESVGFRPVYAYIVYRRALA